MSFQFHLIINIQWYFYFALENRGIARKNLAKKNIEIDDIKNSYGYLEQIIKTVL